MRISIRSIENNEIKNTDDDSRDFAAKNHS